MSVTVDHQPLEAEQMGLSTLGQLLAHLQNKNRLVVHVLIDGQEPDLNQMPTVRKLPIEGHTLFIETANPRELVIGVLDEVELQLAEADRLRTEACDLLARSNHQKAMEKLAGCFSTWQHAQESILKTARLLRLDLASIEIDGQPLTSLVVHVAAQLRQIKDALENRDFVALGDILTYEATQTTSQWRQAVSTIRRIVEDLK